MGTKEEIDKFCVDLIKDMKIEVSPMDSKEGCILFEFDLSNILDKPNKPIICEGYYVNKFVNKHLEELQLWFKSTEEFVDESWIEFVYKKYNLENMNTYYKYNKNMIGLIKKRHRFDTKKSFLTNIDFIAIKWIDLHDSKTQKKFLKEENGKKVLDWSLIDKQYEWEVFWYNYIISILIGRLAN